MFDSEKVNRLFSNFREGDSAAAGSLMEVFYPELRRLAGARMKGERADHTWQPTALVNELYLEMVKVRALGPSGSTAAEAKKAFFAIAANLMRQLLIQHSRPLYRRAEKVELDPGSLRDPANPAGEFENLQALEDLLAKLSDIDPKLRTVVELRVFEGLTGDQIASRMNCTRRSVARYWSFASEWLGQELGTPEA